MDEPNIIPYQLRGSSKGSGTSFMYNFDFFYGAHWNPDVTNLHGWSFWIKPTTLATQQAIFSKYDWSNGLGYYLDLNVDGSLKYWFEGTFGSLGWVTTNAGKIAVNEWTHVMISHNGGNSFATFGPKIAINGVNSTASSSSTLIINSILHTVPFKLWTRLVSPTVNGLFYTGYMADLCYFFSMTPSFALAEKLYNSGRPIDVSTIPEAYPQRLFGANLNKWHSLTDNDEDYLPGRFNSFTLKWQRSKLSYLPNMNFLTAALTNYALLESGTTDSVVSQDSPSRSKP